jgi:hypothetical protein
MKDNILLCGKWEVICSSRSNVPNHCVCIFYEDNSYELLIKGKLSVRCRYYHLEESKEIIMRYRFGPEYRVFYSQVSTIPLVIDIISPDGQRDRLRKYDQ